MFRRLPGKDDYIFMGTNTLGEIIYNLRKKAGLTQEALAKAVERSILSQENVTCISVTHRLTPEARKQYTAVFTMDAGQLQLTNGL